MTSEPVSGEILPAAPDRPAEPAVMPLVDHLSELRGRIIWSIVAVGLGSVVGFLFSADLIEFLRQPLPAGLNLVTLGIGDAFGIRLRIAVVVGIILAMPVILWHIWRFVAPGLTASERRVIIRWIPATLGFFLIGCVIAWVILPFAVQFLLGFQTPDLVAMLTAKEYFNFVSTLFLVFGIVMEFPVLLVGLSRVGIVTSERLTRSRRYVILGITVFAAVATPGTDLVSPTVLGVTMYVLFEITVVIIRRSGR
jgi:sec-independent protein translocase protein TatC